MALNFSQRPIFPPHLSEDALVSPIRLVDGCIVNNGVVENGNIGRRGDDYGMCRSGGANCCQDSDVFDFLPADPFGMDISSTFTAITGWLEDLEMSNVGYVGNVGVGVDGDNPFFAGLNLLWNNAMAMKIRPFPALAHSSGFSNRYTSLYGVYPDIVGMQNLSEDVGSSSGAVNSGCYVDFREGQNSPSYVGGLGAETVFEGSYNCIDSRNSSSLVGRGSESVPGHESIRSCNDSMRCGRGHDAVDVSLAVNVDDPGYDCEMRENSGKEAGSCFREPNGSYPAGSDGTPHYALYLALGYLGVRDLLSVERVCRSLRLAVQTENSLWRSIHVHQPLNEKITDEVLLQLTDKARGKLECLSLVECPRITDDGLRRVLKRNPELRKLSVPGCTRLSIQGLLESLRTLRLLGTLNLKHVHIGGIYGVTEEQFDELKLLLGMEGEMQPGDHKPHFYQRGNLYLPCEDDRVIDIEMCPRCQKARLVYDCPDEACMVKDAASQVCRACTLCIARCFQCGRCINDMEYEETFCLELLCSNCSNQESMKHPGTAGRFIAPSERAALDVDHQDDGISFCG
ncbi:hypothetical protein MLD38_002368 [Melastoma candidum]|uniref:Uncharacterized protein n=1 Tax=Melastoma candidum TaxID=119954 RepID=A0ACB9RYK2_9MYRT|nr:hypothetical protein MLD38_002368 [Melastoma candidum]